MFPSWMPVSSRTNCKSRWLTLPPHVRNGPILVLRLALCGITQLVLPSTILRLTSSQVLRTFCVNSAQSSMRLKIFLASSR
jgi:hypothetical protein